ncbi:dihydrodipicolinate synthase family protein [Elioraea sp.]|jgi:dihydrodipicolinate synthase/N-acetylneuraminate lyase|uniref:dihydrodipicolinate synthase family protein n=1 Tax=Elioraea sp. TaxID=2185103 RepID=UPI003F7154BF
MNDGKVDWHGNIVAVATPFTQDGALDEVRFKANIAQLLDEGADGIAVCGCTGEAWALDPEERMQLFRWARAVIGPKVPLIGGTTAIRTDRTIALSRAAIEAGCDGVLLMPPYYAVIGPREIKAHLEAVSTGLRAPIFLYNMPKRTSINMSPALLAELARIEWVVALKQSSNDFNELEATLDACGERISVFAGHSAERGFAAVMLGCPGFVSSLEAQVMGREAIALYALARAGRVEEGRRVQQRCIALDKAMRQVGTFPANMKSAMNLLGRHGGHCRSPLLDLDAAETTRVAAILDGLGLTPRAAAA